MRVRSGPSLPLAPAAPPSRRRLELVDARPVDRVWRPVHAVWEITLRCDLACRTCGSRAGRARPDELSTTEAHDLIDQMAAMGVREVTLIGGEAYLREDWIGLVERITRRGMACTMTTGGRGIDARRAREARAAGMDHVSVSVDGMRETHDALRGVPGSYEAALDALHHLAAAGIRITCNSQVGARSLFELEGLLPILADAGIVGWQCALTVPMGRAADDPSLLLQPYQMLEVHPMLARLVKAASPRGVRVRPGNNLGYFGPYEALLRPEKPECRAGACGAGRTTLGIEANGDIKGCPSLPSHDYVGGNVRDADLRTIWERTPPLRFTRRRTKADLWGRCRDCYYAEACEAGCSWTSHVVLGRRGNNPFCHHRALELLREGRRERLLPAEPAPGLPFDHRRFELVEETWPPTELERARDVAAGRRRWLS